MDSQPVALITGGSGALATALHGELIEAGWQVLAPLRSELDVTSPEQLKRFYLGLTRLDLLINNAGIRRDALLLRQSEADRDAVLDVCLRGAFLCSRAAARLMVEQKGGHIVNLGSNVFLHSMSAVSGQVLQLDSRISRLGL